MISRDEEILLNCIAQGIRTVAYGKVWFQEKTTEQRLQILNALETMILQAEATEQDVHNAILKSKLRKTLTPCTILAGGPLRMRLVKMKQLPNAEQDQAFVLLIALLSIADNRRRLTKCAKGCTHWWHKLDSDNPQYTGTKCSVISLTPKK